MSDSAGEVVNTWSDATGERPPLLVLDEIEHFFDDRRLGSGPLRWARVGDGQSNLTYRIDRDGRSFALRRGPRPPLPPSAHDMVREARFQVGLGRLGIPVPRVLAICNDSRLLGVPFYVMEWADGVVVTDRLPGPLADPASRRRLSISMIEALVRLHSVDVTDEAIADFGHPDGYLERQIAKFASLWETSATRTLPEVIALAEWLRDNLPASTARPTPAVVHGDFRLGNLMLQRRDPTKIAAILDWEMATLGDPLTDLGYLTATYSDADAQATVLHMSPVTAAPGFLTGDELVAEYGQRTGMDVRYLPWYRTLALWKGAVFCEAIYRRWLDGERPDDTFGPRLDVGVPALLTAATKSAAFA